LHETRIFFEIIRCSYINNKELIKNLSFIYKQVAERQPIFKFIKYKNMQKLSTDNKLGNKNLPHRNSNANMELHHLYEIVDKETEDTFKYGISGDPIGEDGLSRRVRVQVKEWNELSGWERFFGRVLITDISGNTVAREIETKHIKDYELKHGRKPKKNRICSRKS
jgi:hypothetical protein